MRYDVHSQEIKLTNVPEDHSPALHLQANGSYKIIWSDEGFMDELEAIAPLLKQSAKQGQFRVYMSDHKGQTSFKVKFGPGYFEEL